MNKIPAEHNMEYLGLRNKEYQMHEYLMEGPMEWWPENLQELVEHTSKEIGLCGDVVSCAVAEWIKGKRVQPVAPVQP